MAEKEIIKENRTLNYKKTNNVLYLTYSKETK